MSGQARAKAAAATQQQAPAQAGRRRGFASVDAAEEISTADMDGFGVSRSTERPMLAREHAARTSTSAAVAPHRPTVVRKRRDESDTAAGMISEHIRDVLRTPGEALDAATRRHMERSFGHDFGRVRVHADARAAGSAQAENALAYTVGRHIAFAPGRYSPRSRAGQYLLAHELTHVAQQSRGGVGVSPRVEDESGEEEANGNAAAIVGALPKRRISVSPRPVSLRRSVGIPILGPIINAIFDWFDEGTFSDETLLKYLRDITTKNRIEDRIDSDNKARAIVLRWKASNAKFDLSARQKVLLVIEMLSGDTQKDDQERILDLLELSSNPDLKQMFLGGLSVTRLEEKLDGERRERLESFFFVRFDGERRALLEGKVNPRGPAGIEAPRFPGSFMAKLETYSAEELIEEISAFYPSDRDDALHDLSGVRTAVNRDLNALNDQLVEAPPDKKSELTEQRDALLNKQTKLELVMEHVFADVAKAEAPEELRAKAVEPGAQRKTRILEEITPSVRKEKDKSGKPPEPTDEEQRNYKNDLRHTLLHLVERHYRELVVGRGEKERTGPNKQLYSPGEIDGIAQAGKDETDRVFGQYNKAPQLKVGDLYERVGKEQSDPHFDALEAAKNHIFYYLQAQPQIREVNRRHKASPEFDKANKAVNIWAKLQVDVTNEFLQDKQNIQRANQINRGWPAQTPPEEMQGQGPGAASPAPAPRARSIYVQFFKPVDAEVDRKSRWRMFQTIVHEYLHTLVDSAYYAYANRFGDNSRQFNTLVEGVDSLLTETVWSNVYRRVNDGALRLKVEGPKYSRDLPPPSLEPLPLSRYESLTEALKLVNVVGIRNLYAAYFLGDIKKIGAGPQPKTIGGQAARAPAITHDVLQTRGQPLDGTTRMAMETRFGRSFADVRVHTDADAARSARDARAQAYTVAPHVVFGPGRYAPDTVEGRRLLAHELTHVVQQSATTGRNDPDRAAEDEADRIGAIVAAGGSSTVHLAKAGRAPQRQAEAAVKQAMSRAEFDSIMADRYRVQRVHTGKAEEQYLGKEKRTDWMEWDPGASSEVYNWIVQAFMDFEKTFAGVPAVKEIVFFRMEYVKQGDQAVEDPSVGASYSAETLQIFSAMQRGNKMFDLREKLESPTREQAVRRNITHELGHGIIETTKTQTTDKPPGADPQMLADYSTAVGWVKVGDVNQLYDIQEPAVQQALQKGKIPPDQFQITPKNFDRKSWKELPLTGYMASEPQEDFAEAVMAYVNEPERLKLHSPSRYAFIDGRKEKWTAPGQPKMNIWERASRGIHAPRTLQPSRKAASTKMNIWERARRGTPAPSEKAVQQ